MPEQVQLYCNGFGVEEDAKEINVENKESIADRFEQIYEKIGQIDDLINQNTEGWDTSRIGKVELTILRLAIYEMRFDDEIPESVAIDEAVEIAKKYGQEGSGGFVNAILAKIAKIGD